MDVTEHMRAVWEEVREAAERIGHVEAEHGPDSPQAQEARAD